MSEKIKMDEEGKNENLILKSQIQNLREELQTERDSVTQLRKRINSVERDRLDAISKSNEQNSKTGADLTRLRAQLEKSEAVRQSLEFDLVKVNRELNYEKKSSVEKDNLLINVSSDMKDQISTLKMQKDDLNEELKLYKLNSQHESSQLKSSLEHKEKLIRNLQENCNSIESENIDMSRKVQIQSKTLVELEEELANYKERCNKQDFRMREYKVEHNSLSDRENRLQKDYEVALKQVKNLEENIESERAAHLETKYNSELIHLRAKDLENKLCVLKQSKEELNNSMDELSEKYRTLQKKNEKECKLSSKLQEQLNGSENKYKLLSEQWDQEIKDKKETITDLSKQLVVHQQNFDKLKNELHETKKKQIDIEESYGGNMRELELLLHNFQVNTNEKHSQPLINNKKGKTLHSKNKDKRKSNDVVIENVRNTLFNYKNLLDANNLEICKLKAQLDRSTKEQKGFKEQVISKEQIIHEKERKSSETISELGQLKAEVAILKKKLEESRKLSKACSDKLIIEQNRNSQLEDKISQINERYKKDEKIRMEFLHCLYQQLLTGRFMAKLPEGSSDDSFDWFELTTLLTDQVSTIITALNKTQEKVRHMEVITSTREDSLEQLQKAHEEQVEKLATIGEERSRGWTQQRQEIEAHYGRLLTETHTRHKKSQMLADEAWCKVRELTSQQQLLEQKLATLDSKLEKTTTERQSLLIGLALLSGIVYPLLQRNKNLSLQRTILSEHFRRLEEFSTKVRQVVDALELSKSLDGDIKLKTCMFRHPLLRFRRGVIAVLAANRLCALLKNRQCLFTLSDQHLNFNSYPFCIGSNLNDKVPEHSISEKAIGWLTSTDLQSSVISSVSDLHSTINKSPTSNGNELISQTSLTTQKLLQSLLSFFSCLFVTPARRSRTLLIHRLETGLFCAKSRYQNLTSTSNLREMFLSLQQGVMGLTHRLHDAEVKRRDAQQEVAMLKEDKHKSLADLQKKMAATKSELSSRIGREKFDGVCSELEHALRREQKAQALMNQQIDQIQQLTSRLSSEEDRELSLSETSQELQEARSELNRHEQVIRQLNERTALLESEKSSLELNIKNAENTLKTTTRDRQQLLDYVKKVESAIEQINLRYQQSDSLGAVNLNPLDLTPLMDADQLPNEVIKIGPELAACRLLVNSFIESEQRLSLHSNSLLQEINSLRARVSSLTAQLGAAHRHTPPPGAGAVLSSDNGTPPVVLKDRSKFDYIYPTHENITPPISTKMEESKKKSKRPKLIKDKTRH